MLLKVSSHEAIDTMKAAIKAAQAKFRAAKVALGIISAMETKSLMKLPILKNPIPTLMS